MPSQSSRPLPGPNDHLIGREGAATSVSTPCLILDAASFERNVVTAANHCRAAGIALRPHAKTHKCATIAKAQLDAGAQGICVATIGEAEAMVAAGIEDILVTSVFTQPAKIGRAIALAKTGARIAVVADDPGMVDRLAAAAGQAGIVLPVLVDVDLGRHRNGVTDAAGALAVASAIARSPALELSGMQAYASHISHVEGFAERRAAANDCAGKVAEIRDALTAAGHTVSVVTGGSTGTLFIDPSLGVYTELQCGSYVFSDVEYASMSLDGSAQAPFAPALFVRVTVIGRNWPGRVTCDGGNKHFSAKGTLPTFRRSPVAGAIYRPDSDEHGIIELPQGAAQPPLGSLFDLVVPHCDPTVNLFDAFHVVDGDTLTDIWPIEARGAF